LTPQRLFTAKTLFQLDFFFCLHSITVVPLSKPVHFVVMKCSRTEKRPWIKSKTKPGLNMKKIDEFHPDRRQNLAESDKGSWFNQPSKSEATNASSLNISAVSKKKIMASKRKQCYERVTSKNEYGLFFVVGFFIVRNECLLAFLKLCCGTFSAVCFCFVKVRFYLSFCPLLTMAKTFASLNPCCGTCSVVCFCSDEGRRFPFVFLIVSSAPGT